MEKTYIVNGQVYLDHRFAQATVGKFFLRTAPLPTARFSTPRE